MCVSYVEYPRRQNKTFWLWRVQTTYKMPNSWRGGRHPSPSPHLLHLWDGRRPPSHFCVLRFDRRSKNVMPAAPPSVIPRQQHLPAAYLHTCQVRDCQLAQQLSQQLPCGPIPIGPEGDCIRRRKPVTEEQQVQNPF